MKCLFALASAFLVAGPAPLGTEWSADIPPERFHGDNAALVIFASDVTAYCTAVPPPGKIVVACAFRTPEGVPVVVLPNPCPVAHLEYTARIACHELAHVNLWSGMHER